jgi:riboflavin synthase
MFTGIVTDLGTVSAIRPAKDPVLEITTAYPMGDIPIGASICCSGVCLTVIEKGQDWFAVSVSQETMDRTTIGTWVRGTAVNLERSMTLGAEFGGHIVTGHVDDVAVVRSVVPEGGSKRMVFEAAADLLRLVARKGSVAIDGVSLTVNGVDGTAFAVNIVPHTLACTTFAGYGPGTRVNLEVDILARYVARILESDGHG